MVVDREILASTKWINEHRCACLITGLQTKPKWSETKELDYENKFDALYWLPEIQKRWKKEHGLWILVVYNHF